MDTPDPEPEDDPARKWTRSNPGPGQEDCEVGLDYPENLPGDGS